jgi:hypothetical protein
MTIVAITFLSSCCVEAIVSQSLLTRAVAQVPAIEGDKSDKAPNSSVGTLSWVELSEDGTRFVTSDGQPFRVWGVNYDHDGPGRLLEDYWIDEWETVVADFREIKELGANVVRIHLQLGKFMKTAADADEAQLAQLGKLLQLAEQLQLRLDVTGLGCYHKSDIPTWYDSLDESARWAVQEQFWRSVAAVCKESPAVFCYDLMNEPILPGQKAETEWLTGELGGKYFVQRIALQLNGRTREEVAAVWVERLTKAIREVDSKHLITVGVIPWAQVFPGAKPIFYAPPAAKHLDFVSVHFYPKKDEVDQALTALQVYEIGKPLVIEEFFPLSCSLEEAKDFLNRANVDGLISFYWGETIEQNRQAGDIRGAIIADWLSYFQSHASTFLAQ